MNSQQVLATLVMAVLTVSAVSVAGLTNPAQTAFAQANDIAITTSADTHERTFFGHGVLQVVITDESADDDDTQEELTVEIDAESDDGSDGGSFTIPETSQSSGRFEFFLVHAGSDLADGVEGENELDPINTNEYAVYSDIDFDGEDDPAPIIQFGTGAAAGELDEVASDLFTDVSFDIQAGDVEISVDYEEFSAELTLDRTTYGSTSVVHIFVNDQDANLNPTESDEFEIAADDLVDVLGTDEVTFADAVTFEETGDNTAVFEAEVALGTDMIREDDAEAVQFTLTDLADYSDVASAENTSTDTSDANFDIDDVDGDIDELGAITFGSELKITIRDNDQNRDSDDDDTIDFEADVSGLVVETESGSDTVEVALEETGDDTGVFTPDTANNEIKITFVEEGGAIADNEILELEPGDITGDILVTYLDPLNDDSEEDAFETTLEVSLANPTVELPDTAGINDDFTLTVNDADLNDNPRSRDSYTFILDDEGPYPLARGATELDELANFEIEIEGDSPVAFAEAITYTLVETGVNTGIFTTSLDMAEILANAEANDDGDLFEIEDGDTIEVTYNDFFDDQSREASDEVSIGKPSTGVDFSRTVLPIPPQDGSDVDAFFDGDGDAEDEDDGDGTLTPVFTTLMVTDPDQNTLSTTEDTLDFVFELDADEGAPSFRVEVEGDGVDETIRCELDDEDDDTACSATNDLDGSVLAGILPALADGITLSETSKSSGVFDEELEFEAGELDLDEWQDLEVTITYFDADGDEESTGITFRGNDGQLSVDQNSAKSGTTIVITVQDEDLNLDDDTAEEFEASVGAASPFIISVETEDDEIEGGTTTETFRETGPDTGVFEAEYLVGTDIQVTEDDGEEVAQATNILITYNDEVDSTGGSGDELESNVPVVTSTGAIEVTPALVGPGTELTVLITDTDLDQDARATEDYDPDTPDSDDFFVSFRSDRSEVGEASPELEETGPNTGVFSFTIELVSDEADCADDDLGDDAYDATGGSEPSIGACPGDLISIRYEDEQDASGRSTVVSQVVEIRSWDPEFASDKESYSVGDRVSLTISDPDANRDPDIADSLTDIRVFSSSDQVGEELSALETGKSTGVFRLSFTVSSGTESGAITVKQGDTVTVEYTDDFPADFEEEEEDKEFQFTIRVAGKTGVDTTRVTEPALKDVTGRTLSSLAVGQQAVLSTTVVNQNDEPRPFTALVEVRDSDGITVFLAWQTGTLNANGQSEVGLSWTPEDAGSYTVRTFVISDLQNPQVLSTVSESSISVSG